MPTESDRRDVQKAMAYDLIRILESDNKETYSVEDLKKLLNAYISGIQH